MIILISSIQEENGYNPVKYQALWKTTMENYAGYMDHATKITLERGE